MKVVIGPNMQHLEDYLPALHKEFPTVEFINCTTPEELNANFAAADVFVGFLGAKGFSQAKNLKWIQSLSTGVDGFMAVPEIRQGEVLLTCARGTHAPAVADSTMGMILAITRGLWDAWLKRGDKVFDFRRIRSRNIELTGKTLGLIGFGAIGQEVAKRAHGFGMRIIATDLYDVARPEYVEAIWPADQLHRLLKESDFVVTAVPLTTMTRHMIGAKEFAAMKPDAVFLHMSRGGVVDENALIAALNEKRIAAAAMDVFESEPLPSDSPLWTMDNVVLAPHVAGGTQYEAERVVEIFRKNLAQFLRGETPSLNLVDKVREF